MNQINELLDEIREAQRPTHAENAAVSRIAEEFIGKIDRGLRAAKVKAKAVLGGSGAKGTWLRGVHDIDVFACFDYARYKEKSGELSELLAAAIKKEFPKHERLHGSRDYFKISREGYNFEVVPILNIKKASQAKNITDASLLHSAWVKGKVRKNPAVAEDIRLTKAFCRAQKVYGAESYVRGFSGYSCEVLTIYYGSFLKLITTAPKWKKQISSGMKIIVDPANHYKRRDPLRELNSAKVQSELIVIDPVQADRNATAALSNETLKRFTEAAGAFAKKPSREFFEKKEVTIEQLLKKAKGEWLVVVEATPLRGKEDVVGAKLVKAQEHIKEQLEHNGFKPLESGWEWSAKNKTPALLWCIIKKEKLEPEIRYGPPAGNSEHAERFRNEHNGKAGRAVFEKAGRLYARIERVYKEPGQLAKALIDKDAYLKDKAQQFSVKGL